MDEQGIDWQEQTRKHILYSLDKQRLLPFLGAGMAVPFIPLSKDLANALAKEDKCPFEPSDLSKVTEFLSFKYSDTNVAKGKVSRMIKDFSKKFFFRGIDNTHYSILSDLDFPMYITTNYDLLLEETLKSQGKKPISEFCIWSESVEKLAEEEGYTSMFDNDNDDEEFSYDSNKPIVYHLHGQVDHPYSLLITESDYIDFLVTLIRKGDHIMPVQIRALYSICNLLFIGYSLQDINFHVLNKFMGNIAKIHYTVSLPPSDTKVMKYSREYFSNRFNIRIFWSDAKKFLIDLKLSQKSKTSHLSN
jgi:hypothetical protein